MKKGTGLGSQFVVSVSGTEVSALPKHDRSI